MDMRYEMELIHIQIMTIGQVSLNLALEENKHFHNLFIYFSYLIQLYMIVLMTVLWLDR